VLQERGDDIPHGDDRERIIATSLELIREGGLGKTSARKLQALLALAPYAATILWQGKRGGPGTPEQPPKLTQPQR
jgi:hypothetical protein